MRKIATAAFQFSTAVAVALFAALLFATPASADMPAKSEVTLGGEFVKFDNPDDHGGDSDAWTFSGSALFPWTKSGKIVGGPTLAVGSADEWNRLGLRVDWNLFGQGPVTFYLGISAVGYQEDVEGEDRMAGIAHAGFKFGIGPGAAIYVGASDVVEGRGKDSTDLGGAAGILARW